MLDTKRIVSYVVILLVVIGLYVVWKRVLKKKEKIKEIAEIYLDEDYNKLNRVVIYDENGKEYEYVRRGDLWWMDKPEKFRCKEDVANNMKNLVKLKVYRKIPFDEILMKNYSLDKPKRKVVLYFSNGKKIEILWGMEHPAKKQFFYVYSPGNKYIGIARHSDLYRLSHNINLIRDKRLVAINVDKIDEFIVEFKDIEDKNPEEVKWHFRKVRGVWNYVSKDFSSSKEESFIRNKILTYLTVLQGGDYIDKNKEDLGDIFLYVRFFSNGELLDWYKIGKKYKTNKAKGYLGVSPTIEQYEYAVVYEYQIKNALAQLREFKLRLEELMKKR